MQTVRIDEVVRQTVILTWRYCRHSQWATNSRACVGSVRRRQCSGRWRQQCRGCSSWHQLLSLCRRLLRCRASRAADNELHPAPICQPIDIEGRL